MLKKNSRHKIEITGVTAKGFGVGHIDNFLLFVDGGLTGDVLEIHVLKTKPRYGYGKIINILTPSPSRIESPCPVFMKCGGCQWQNCEYSAQLKYKKQIVIDALERIGGITNPAVNDVIGMENPQRYRNKAVFPVVPQTAMPLSDGSVTGVSPAEQQGLGGKDPIDDKTFAIGMYMARSHRIVEVSDCRIQHIAHVSVLETVRKYMHQHNVTAYDETTHTGIMRHIMVRTSLFTNEIMVVLVINAKSLPNEMELIEKLIAIGVTTTVISNHQSKGNSVLGKHFRILNGSGFIRERIGETEYQISAPSFFQVNPVQTKILYDVAIEQAGLNGTQIVLDAHVGAGGVALYSAKKAKQVIGVDIVQSAINDAGINATINGVNNAEFICGAAEDIVPDLLQTHQPDVIFLDPPRKGNEPALLEAIISSEIKKIVYISCDPATLARDIKKLTEGGYKLITAQPVDMFPFTGKVETSVLLNRV